MTRPDWHRVSRPMLSLVAFGGVVLAAACGESDRSDVGTVTVALVQVPTDVSCISITVAGNRTVTRLSDVMPGQPSVLTLGGLPVGTDTFTGAAFGTACAMVDANAVPSWVGGPVTAVVTVMSPTPVTLVLQRNGRSSVSVDFNDGTTCGPMSCPTGCCSAGTCNPGNTSAACGAAGNACQQCAGGQTCTAGACSNLCDASTCPSGCCAGATCVPRTFSTCGGGGSVCVACDPTRADNCGPSDLCACGTAPPCGSGQTCMAGVCVSSCNATTCPNGCCAGGMCVPGNASGACGAGGAVCVTCAGGTSCINHSCM